MGISSSKLLNTFRQRLADYQNKEKRTLSSLTNVL
ncbi:hypothetical protein EVA_18383 [gut metagenome]|uniref:Uncharacterized protein n=1 Tax=gut metagenome TaxID=749906 RepID=J9C108_9ZZZZ